MADGDTSGIGGGIMSLLTNPAVETILPTLLGAGAGVLSAPPMSGTRGAIGGGLAGAAGGLTSGLSLAARQPLQKAEMESIQQHTANMKLDAQKLQQSLGDEQQYSAVINEMAGKMPDGPDKETFLALSNKDPATAIAYYTHNNSGSRDADAKIISSVFGDKMVKPEQIAAMPADVRGAYRNAAMHVLETNRVGQVIQGDKGVYFVQPNPEKPSQPRVIQLKDDKGNPVMPLRMTLANLQQQGAMERALLGAESREGIAIDRAQAARERNAFSLYEHDQSNRTKQQQNWDKLYGGMDEDTLAQMHAPPRPEDLPDFKDVQDRYMGMAGAAAPAPSAAPSGSAPAVRESATGRSAEAPTGSPAAPSRTEPRKTTDKGPPPRLIVPKWGEVEYVGPDPKKPGWVDYRLKDGRLIPVDPKNIPADAIPKG